MSTRAIPAVATAMAVSSLMAVVAVSISKAGMVAMVIVDMWITVPVKLKVLILQIAFTRGSKPQQEVQTHKRCKRTSLAYELKQ